MFVEFIEMNPLMYDTLHFDQYWPFLFAGVSNTQIRAIYVFF